jgi:hypothetical protein
MPPIDPNPAILRFEFQLHPSPKHPPIHVKIIPPSMIEWQPVILDQFLVPVWPIPFVLWHQQVQDLAHLNSFQNSAVMFMP